MEIEYGAEVTDRNGRVLGTVDHLMHNTWTGEISKFMIRRKAPDSDLLFSVEDVLQATKSKIRLNISLDELSEDA
jgi:sporulation protein YlmC with PRC-barrel domain